MNWRLVLRRLKSPATARGRWCRWIILALLVYTVLGFFIFPPIIRWQLVKRLPGLTHRQAAVRKVKLNPYALSLTIQGLSLTETNGQPFAGFDEFYVNFELSSLIHWAWTFSEIKLTHPTGSIVRDAAGQFNFANLLTPAPTPPPAPTGKPKSLPPVIVQLLTVTNGQFSFTDQTRATPLRLEYGPINFVLRDLTTRPNQDGRYALAVTTGAGGRFSWSGTLGVNPLNSAGKFALEGVRLKTYSPYLADFTKAELADGVLAVGAEYRVNAAAQPLELEVTNATLTLDRLQLTAPEMGETLLALNRVSVEGASASLARRQARVRRVTLSGGSLLARRESDGQLNWLKLLVAHTNAAAAPAPAATNAPARPPAPWQAIVDELDLEDLSVTAEDRVPPTPAQLGLDGLRVQVKGISIQSNAPVTATVDFKWRGGGTVHAAAEGTLLPPAGAVSLAITNLALPPLQPYVEQEARVVLNAGDLTVNGQARYAPGERGSPLARFSGDVSVARFAASDTVAYHNLAKWNDLDVRGIQLALQPDALTVEEVKFRGLATSLVVNSNGQLNVGALLKEKPAPVAAAPTSAPAGATAAAGPTPFPIKVGAVVFEKCSFQAANQSLLPRFDTSIEEFNGTIRDLALPGLNKAGVDIHGKVSALAPFAVTGTITPNAKNPYVDLKLSLKNDDLTPFSPYTGKYAGYPLDKGKLSFDLGYHIVDRRLQASNVVVIDQLTFGARNQSTNATKLPVKLAVALLKDRNGRINLDLPVSGSLDDPKFNIAALVWKVVMNLLVKAATSPFSLLGAMFGGGEELQYVDFPPGAATLPDTQTNNLVKLAKALYERPALKMEISASVNPATDGPALAREKLQDKLKALRAQELTAHGKPVPPLNELTLDPADYERLLRDAYKAAFKEQPEKALREARLAAAATNAPGLPGVAASPVSPPTSTEKGATLLLRRTAGAPPAPTPSSASPPGATAPPPKPKSEAELVLEEMEQRLMAAQPATDDDFRQLMLQRAQAVQKLLLDSGQVTAGRLFLIAPKPVEPGTQGLARATFSLD